MRNAFLSGVARLVGFLELASVIVFDAAESRWYNDASRRFMRDLAVFSAMY